MHIPLLSRFITDPLIELKQHAEKVRECIWIFQEASECYFSENCTTFTELRDRLYEISLKSKTNRIKIKDHLPKLNSKEINKTYLLVYLYEINGITDSIEAVMDWLQLQKQPGIYAMVEKEFLLLIDAVINPVEELTTMVGEIKKLIKSSPAKRRKKISKTTANLHKQCQEAIKASNMIKQKLFLKPPKKQLDIIYMLELTAKIEKIIYNTEKSAEVLHIMLV